MGLPAPSAGTFPAASHLVFNGMGGAGIRAECGSVGGPACRAG